MAMLNASAVRIGRITIPNSAANVAAGDWTGTNSAAGAIVGTASGRTRIKTLRFQAQGATVLNLLRIYRENITGGTKTLVAIVAIPKLTPDPSENRSPWMRSLEVDIRLASADQRLAYQLEAVPGSVIVVEEEAVDWA
jgi:hypothetical protein